MLMMDVRTFSKKKKAEEMRILISRFPAYLVFTWSGISVCVCVCVSFCLFVCLFKGLCSPLNIYSCLKSAHCYKALLGFLKPLYLMSDFRLLLPSSDL